MNTNTNTNTNMDIDMNTVMNIDIKVKLISSIIIVICIILILIFGNLSYMCYTNKNEDGFQIKTGWELLELRLSNEYDFEEIHINK